MPELPEVETIARKMRRTDIVGHTITHVQVSWERTLQNITREAFRRQLIGTAITDISRRGKWLLWTLSTGKTVCIHLRMSGAFHIASPARIAETHDRVVLQLENGRSIHFRDSRKFGRWHVLSDPEELLAPLGPEPFQLTPGVFYSMLQDRSRMLKPLLLDQHFIAGMGNIYTDEALWRARLHPARIAHTLSKKSAGTLLRAMVAALNAGIRNQGTSLGTGLTNYIGADGKQGRNQLKLNVYGRTGQPCPRCHAPISKTVIAQRGTHLCTTCQQL